jgi:hypothetical protein
MLAATMAGIVAAIAFAQSQAPEQGQAQAAQAAGQGVQQPPAPLAPPPAPPLPASKTTVLGVLAFVDSQPAIKTDGATVLLLMPRFYMYAYQKGYKAGVAIKATGMLASSPDKAAPAAIVAEEVAIGSDTYIVVPADRPPAPRLGPPSFGGR